MSDTPVSKGDQRRQQIMTYLKLHGRITIQDMIQQFGCSEATARRDLDLLEKKSGLVRTIGGALLESFPVVKETSFRERSGRLWAEKEAIAAKAMELIEEGDIIALSGGTTNYLIARNLKERKALTVVTNAVNIAMELAESEHIQVVVTGGVMRNKSFELCGPLTEKLIEHLNIGKLFLGVDGLSEQGISTFSELEAATARTLIRKSRQTIIVFDHTKVGKPSLFHICPLSDLDGCVTDRPLQADYEEHLTKYGVQIHVAQGQLQTSND
ncbi:DeoR/GlpR family DNA-binding transcription regulator [Paenibacillus sp. GD4]|uniref:DeoR/GlpR family DNA-binding transcription regulator n=1 Tax=Paenibacillus sp. GD4 TaxID=3068890 RepID=UPI002796C35C|nr:DeoR/GlpR family DNA-binding transcription regulator [Paenibacillus sp. GD4]MDQ1909619.1 DeoR/GlpR family DNA-binding transcription regulator [Paenibacillus sp. GD4]